MRQPALAGGRAAVGVAQVWADNLSCLRRSYREVEGLSRTGLTLMRLDSNGEGDVAMETHRSVSAAEQNLEEAVIYARRVYDHTLEWYKNADAKAEIILALDGIFLSFVTVSIFINPSNLSEILSGFSPITWVFLVLMGASLIGSVICAIGCLWSRISLSGKARERFLADWQIKPDKAETYKPEATWFFQQISWLEAEAYKEYLMKADGEFEIKALGDSLSILSQHVLKKHRLVDWSFALGASSLICFFCMGVSYVIIAM
jgi:hypothetical protein